MKQLHFSKRITILIIMVLGILSTSLYAYAYFENKREFGFTIQTGEFEVIAYVSFDQVPVDLNSPYMDLETKTILVNAFDSESENYIGKLKVDIEITPNINARARIKVFDEWELTRTYSEQSGTSIEPIVQTIYHTAKSSDYLPFSLLKTGDNYNMIYDENGYAYIPNQLIKKEVTMIHLIDGGDAYPIRENEIYMETCYVNLRFVVEVVQANRFAEIWELDSNFFDE